jgi:hypothetical protein
MASVPLDELKYIVSQGYPVIALVWWAPGYEGGDHYRVIVGYDDVEGVLIINDPWSREDKTDSEYYGSTSQSANGNGRDTSFAGVKWKYEDFLWTWQCPTTRWGVPDLAYGAVFVAPWQVVVSAPEKVTAGERFGVAATITYPCMAPFGSDQFPMFTARAFDAKLNPGDGFSIKKSPDLSCISTLGAGQSVELSWTLVAKDNMEGVRSFEIISTGMVSGSLGPWHDYPAYEYEDVIGGTASFEVMISR